MKILAFADTHENQILHRDIVDIARTSDVELLICAGDFTKHGFKWESSVFIFSKANIPMVFVPGNHEYNSRTNREMCRRFSFVKNIDKKIMKFQNIVFFGRGAAEWCVGSPTFKNPQADFLTRKSFALKRRLYQNKTKIFVSHCPPTENKTGFAREDRDAGSKLINAYIDDIQPDLVICGHIHTPLERESTMGNAYIINVACKYALIDIQSGKVSVEFPE